MNLRSRIDQLAQEATLAKHNFDFQKREIEKLEGEIEKLSKEQEVLKKADHTFKTLIERMNSQSIDTAETLISDGLTQIFDRPFTFNFKVSQKRGNLCYQPILLENDREVDILNSKGGGVADIISILLRIITILVVKPKLERVLLLDESLSQLSKDYVPRAAKFFKELGRKLGFTILMVTHEQMFTDYADQIYHVRKVRGGAVIDDISGHKTRDP